MRGCESNESDQERVCARGQAQVQVQRGVVSCSVVRSVVLGSACTAGKVQ